jgi:serine protease Do
MRSLAFPILLTICLAAPGAALAEEPATAQGWLGVFLGAPGNDEGTDLRGVRVRGIVDGSPADGRLRGSDRIVAVDGLAVSSPEELTTRLRGIDPGSSVSLTVVRRGKEMEVGVRLATRPERTDSLRPVAGWIGVEAIALPPSLRAHFGAPEASGILVSAVAEGGPADAAGIRVGDVVYEASGVPITSLGALFRAVTEAGVDNPVEIALARDGARIVVEPRVQRKPGD